MVLGDERGHDGSDVVLSQVVFIVAEYFGTVFGDIYDDGVFKKQVPERRLPAVVLSDVVDLVSKVECLQEYVFGLVLIVLDEVQVVRVYLGRLQVFGGNVFETTPQGADVGGVGIDFSVHLQEVLEVRIGQYHGPEVGEHHRSLNNSLFEVLNVLLELQDLLRIDDFLSSIGLLQVISVLLQDIDELLLPDIVESPLDVDLQLLHRKLLSKAEFAL